ncbi:protein FAM221A isoform X4 [Dasypus novemcinctus]|uniref:protein FAM221A isoform X4 n=1 Tax=Dasypus novemcinctus TaxID=9361 RepID=UPI000C82BBC6|nr:protein FAM221A isoform X3 [Dasypus novemcinctus]
MCVHRREVGQSRFPPGKPQQEGRRCLDLAVPPGGRAPQLAALPLTARRCSFGKQPELPGNCEPEKGGVSVNSFTDYTVHCSGGSRIVGEDDGGRLFTPEEYEEYKRKVLPIRLQNRLYVSWRSPAGMDCKLVGPETLCFCTHRYKQHKTDFETIPQQRPIPLPCQVTGCLCRGYLYVPLNGSQTIRCRCKHFADQHSAAPGFICNACSKCSGFHSCFTCACGQPAYAHETVVETKQERLAQGKPVGQDVPYAAMGGLTGFSSLAEGYMRLDDSGIGTGARD